MDTPSLSPLSQILGKGSTLEGELTRRLIQHPVVPMHKTADPLSEQVSQALLGQPVTVLDVGEGWRLIRTPDDYEGWVPSEAVVQPPAGWEGPVAEVEDLWANLRGRNNSRLAPISHAPIGTRLPVVGGSEGWIELLLPDGRRGWTELHRVIELEPGTDDRPLRPRTASAICRTARRFLGVPYLWGGCSPLGLDCSGFVQLVLRLHGIQLQRDAGPQSTQGKPVEVGGDYQPADLVFFCGDEDTSGSDDPERITHVGMMLNGHRFIHAKGSNHVRIDSLSEEGWRSRVRRMRRYL